MALRFGKCLLRDVRTRAGFTQEALSNSLLSDLGLRISEKSISKYENNHLTMNPVIMRGICIILGCSEFDLYEWPR